MSGGFIHYFFYFKEGTFRVEGSGAVLTLVCLEASKGGAFPDTAVFALKFQLFSVTIDFLFCDNSRE